MKPSQTLKRHWAEIRRIIASHRYELGKLLGIEVDVLTPNALPDSFREKVLSEAVPV